jgi:hypothetical protein
MAGVGVAKREGDDRPTVYRTSENHPPAHESVTPAWSVARGLQVSSGKGTDPKQRPDSGRCRDQGNEGK